MLMKTFNFLLGSALSLLVVTGANAQPIVATQQKEYVAKKITETLTVDGKANEGFWATAKRKTLKSIGTILPMEICLLNRQQTGQVTLKLASMIPPLLFL